MNKSRPAIDRGKAAAAVARGAAVGGGAYAAGSVLRRHPKLTLGAAILAAILALTPAEKRPQLIKRGLVVVAVLAGLVVALFVAIALVGVTMHPSSVTPAPATTTAPAAPSSCQWPPQFC